MPVTLMPGGGISIKDHITRLHGTGKTNSESASPPTELYIPSKYEIMQVAMRIEETTGMKISESLKKGEWEVKDVSRDKATQIKQEKEYSIFEKYIKDADELEKLRKQIMDESSCSKDSLAFFNSPDNTIYRVSDNTKRLIEYHCKSSGVKPDSPKGKRIEKFINLSSFVHESIHKTVNENYPLIGDWVSNGFTEQAKTIAEFLKTGHKDEEPLNKSLNLISDTTGVLTAYNEGIAYYAGHKIVCKMGYLSHAMELLETVKQKYPHIAKGIAFLEYIEKKTGENPIKYTIKHPPQTMKHIEHPDEYLRDLKEGKV